MTDSEFFAEFKLGINNAWKVGQEVWTFYKGLMPPVLVGPAPTDLFRVAITLAVVTGHADVVGAVHINDEVLEFESATRKTNDRVLSDLPTITVDGLDGDILVEAISVSGAPLYKEKLTPIEIICFPKTSILRDPSGSGWMQTDYQVFSEMPLSIGDQIRYPDPHQEKTIDIYVKNVASGVDLEDNSQPFRVLNCA